MEKLLLFSFFILFVAVGKGQTVESKKLKELEKSMKIESDKFEGVTKVQHKPFVGNSDFRVNCKFIIKDGAAQGLTLRVVHFGKKWLFVNKLTFLIDDKKFDIDVKPIRKVEGGYTVEISDIPAIDIAKQVIESFMKSEKVQLRFWGENSYDDALQLKMDIKRARRVVEYYTSLGGIY